MKSNSLGFVSEIVAPPKGVVNVLHSPPVAVDIENSTPLPTRILSRLPKPPMVSGRTLCCMLTSVLLAAGVGVGVWYAVTEI